MIKHEVKLGPADSFAAYPASVEVDGDPYWLVCSDEGAYRLLSALCPHAGGEVRPVEGVLFCPLHWWTFDAVDGRCLNVEGERLLEVPVEERDDVLYAIPTGP